MSNLKKETRDRPPEQTQEILKKLYEQIINLYEQKANELDGNSDQSAIEFKLLVFDHYYMMYKDKKDQMKKFYQLVNKFLKKESKDIGIKIYRYLYNTINVHPYEKIGETNIRAFTEFLIFINENSPRIKEIWDYNINNFKDDKKLSKNSIELLGYYSHIILYSFQNYNKYLNEHNKQDDDYLINLKSQSEKLFGNISKAVNSIEKIEKESFNNNFKDFVLEKYLFFLVVQTYLLHLLKNKNETKEEVKFICNIFLFALKKTENYYTYTMTLKYLDGILCLGHFQDDKNSFNKEFIDNWKIYLNEKKYFDNKYKSDNKYNLILKFIIKYYLYCLNRQNNNTEEGLFFKELYKNIHNDNYIMLKKLASKVNDFRISLELKTQIMYIIYLMNGFNVSENKEISFDNLYFLMKEMTSFYQTLFTLKNEVIGLQIKEEKQQQKEIFQKNIIKVNIEDNDDTTLKKNNLNHLFLILLSNKYDKYIYIEDPKILFEFMKNSLNILKNFIEIFKRILVNKENINNIDNKTYLINRMAVQLSKFFYFFYYVYERNRVNPENQDNQQELIDKLLEIYLGFNYDLLIAVFKRLMPNILKLYKFGNKISLVKNSISNKLIHNIFKIIKDTKTREILFEIYLDFFSKKIYETGNPVESFTSEPNNFLYISPTVLNESINNISILKSIFFNLLDCVTNFEYFKNKIIPLIIDFLYLSKNSEYYGNYIYILRCFFKYLKSAINQAQSNQGQGDNNEKRAKLKISADFNIEINYILYAIIKYLLNIKEKTPFLSEFISEIIMIMPIKFKFLSEIPHLIFPSLVDSLSSATDNIQICLGNLENWMNIYVKHPESVVPFLEKNLSKITDFLSNNLLKPLYLNVCLVSLKWLSKLGGKGRNYLEKKKIIAKTSPNQILCMKLKEINSERTLDFVLDNIIDICNNLNSNNKPYHKKNPTSSDKNLVYNFIEIYKNCLAAFFPKKIDYDYIIEVKKNIIEGIDFNKDEFNSQNSFKLMNEKNSKIKINSIFRKIEHFLVTKIITGFFLINSSLITNQNNIKDFNNNGNTNLLDFMSDYFLLILLSKEKNNKNMLLFELDPVIFIDEAIHYLFSTHPTIIRNTNVQFTEYSLKIINYILDSINKFFDYDNKIIKNLEIVDIIYMKLLNCCYINDSQRIDSGLMLLKILLQKFDKEVNHKYLKYFFKCMSSVTSNYSNIVKIQFKKGSNHLVEIIEYLIKMYVISSEDFSKLNEDYIKDDKNIKDDMLSDIEKENILNAKQNFIMFYDFIRYGFDEIVEKIDSPNNYTRSLGIYLTNKIIGNKPQLKKIISILFQMDISNLTITEFYKYIKESQNPIDYRQIIFNCNHNNRESKINLGNSIENKYFLKNYTSTKIYKKIDICFNALTRKLGIRDTYFSNSITYSDSLNNIFNFCPSLIEEYIFLNEKNIHLCLEAIKAMYFNILISYFNYCEISINFKNSDKLKTKLAYLFMEQLLVDKNAEHKFKIKNKEGKEIIIENEVKDEYIESIEKYVNENEIYRNEVNTRDYLIADLFELLGLRINMVQQYIKLLNNIFNKFDICKFNQVKDEYNKYIIKTTKLIFIQIFNLHSSSIIKESSSFLCNIFKKYPQIKDEIYKENYNKINNCIEKINEKNVKESTCAENQDKENNIDINSNNLSLQRGHINALLIICKSMKLDEGMNVALTKKISIFQNYLEDKYENSQFVLFYGYISLFLYIDIKEEHLKDIFNQLLNRIKEAMEYPLKNLLDFNETKYHKQIIKLIIKYRHYFSKFILIMMNHKSEHKYIFKLIKNLVRDERGILICETIFNDIVSKIKNEIIIEEKNKNENEIEINLNKLVYLLKISKIITFCCPIFFKKTPFIEIIDDYIKKLIVKYNDYCENMPENMVYEKVIKYWLDLNKIHIEILSKKNKYILSLLYYKSMKNMSNIEKNKILLFITYRLCVNSTDKNSEKKFKSIINDFIKLDDETIKYFDTFVEYLIIPLMIRYLKNYNYFKCFSVSMNKDNTLKVNINPEKKEEKEKKEENKENEEKKDENNNQFIDHEYLINVIERLCIRLNEIKFDVERKEEVKYKLLSLLIVIYLEYLSQKGNNKEYNSKTKNIYYTIQTLLANSPYFNDKQGLGLWRISLLLDIVLFSNQEKNEENFKTIFNYYKNLNEDYSEVENLAYELILPYSKTDAVLEKLLFFNYNELNWLGVFNLLKIILKFPNIINKVKYPKIKMILSYILEISQRLSKSSLNLKKILVQTLGLIITYISKQREYILKNENEKVKIENIPDLEKSVYKVIYKLFEIIFSDKKDKNDNDLENLEILKKIIVYMRELLNSSTSFQMIIHKIDLKSLDSIKYFHIYIQLLRVYALNFQAEFFYQKYDLYLEIYKAMCEKNVNYRYINDFLFLMRLLTDDEIHLKLNNKERQNDITIIQHKIIMLEYIESIIKDKNVMNKKYQNFDLKNFFIGNNTINSRIISELFDNIVKTVHNYFVLNKLYIDRNLLIYNNQGQGNQPINQNNVNYNQQQLQTTNTTVETHHNPPYQPQQQNANNRGDVPQMQQPINNIRNIQQQNNNINQQNNNDKWLESFHINDFKAFILYRKFVDKFYSSIDNNIDKLNNINIQENRNISPEMFNTLKEKYNKKLNSKQENLELMQYYTYAYFENFYGFTLFFLKEYRVQYEIYCKRGYLNYLNSINKEIKEYFLNSHNFYFNLRNFDDLQKIKTESIECILNDKDKDKEKKSLMLINNMFIVYPDIILSGFLFFFQCKEIVEKYYIYLLELFIYTYRYFRDKFYDPLIEDLMKEIIYNKYLEEKHEEKIKFIFTLLNSIELLNPYKIIRTTENILGLFIDYIKSNLNNPNFNKKDQKISQFFHIVIYNATKFDLPKRKNIYELIKSYIGNNLIDCLKWIFTLVDEKDNEIYTYMYYESIPLSIDLLLSYFKEDIPLKMNIHNFSKFKSLQKYGRNDENKMEIENNNEYKINEDDYKKYDKNNYIKKIVENCNSITKDRKVGDLLDPIRSINLLESYSYYKIFITFFQQIWRMLTMEERETLTIYINEFLYKYAEKPKDKNNQIINLIIDTFSQCTPVVYIKPIIIQSLIPYQNFWSTNILYLENLLIAGIDIPSTYNSLINIFNSLQESGLSNGLRYYFSKGKSTKEAFSYLQGNNYLNAENIFYECFSKLKTDILDKIDINNFNLENTNLNNDEFEIFNDLSSWENGLIECYEYNNKWNNIIELSDINNNNELKLKGLWYYGNEKWKELDSFTRNIAQFSKREKNLKSHYIVLINEIFTIFLKLIEDSSNQNQNPNQNPSANDKNYQNICMNCIRNIYQDFNGLNAKNLENINYYYFLIFQLAVESWESMNTLNETLKKKREGKDCNFKDNLLLWRERLPHYCEGIQSLKCILEPRQYLFNILKNLANNPEDKNDPNYTDKLWSDMIFIKYSRKLNLIETFYEKLKLFEEENKKNIRAYPYEIYCKDLEYIKFLRNNIHNYDLGIKKCDEYIKNYSMITEEKLKDFISYVKNTFKRHKAYFNYKKGNIYEAHKLFIEASINKNKESTDYHLYNDWGEMCEEISILSRGEEECSEWFENTIHNYLYTIIYKLDKAKFIIPRMITFIKEFKNESLKDRFNEEINQIPSWIWIFWLPTLFENFNYYQNDNNKNDFFFTILKKVANKYKQIFYYPYTIYQKILNDKNVAENPLNEKYKELNNIIYSDNKYDHCIDKIQLIIDELTKKEKENQENSLNSILNLCEMLTFKNQKFSEVRIFFENVAKILRNFPDLIQFKNNFEELMKNSEITRNTLRECVIKNKYYNHNLIVTENKFKKLSKLCEENIHNIDFNNIELPGYFSNKIEEPNEQNMIYISKFESEYSHKFITDARSKVLIKCSNDKLLNFIIVNQDADKNIDMKIYMMQILFNFIFAKNHQTYKRKVCFITPIKYHISSKIKIVEEDINIKYNMDEIYEYCLQKRGYSPKIANQIFEEEAKKFNINTDLLYYSSENNENLFYKMCKIIPQDSLKNFIHKFILVSEDILLFRKQFTISYSINNLLSFIFLDNIFLKNISFNKETGFCTFNTDLTLFTDNEYREIVEQKEGTPLRLTKNINFFLSITSIYGIIPGVFYYSCDALLNKPKILKSILKICMDNNNNDTKIDKIVQNYINKFKYVLNVTDDKEYFDNKNLHRIKSETFISKESSSEMNYGINLGKIVEKKDKEAENKNNKQMKIIYELIENSMNNENLKKKTIDYEAWF